MLERRDGPEKSNDKHDRFNHRFQPKDYENNNGGLRDKGYSFNGRASTSPPRSYRGKNGGGDKYVM